jgi:hypothetical protein
VISSTSHSSSWLMMTGGGGGWRCLVLTGGSLMTDGRVTQNFQKEKVRSNNSNDGNYLLLRGILSK